MVKIGEMGARCYQPHCLGGGVIREQWDPARCTQTQACPGPDLSPPHPPSRLEVCVWGGGGCNSSMKGLDVRVGGLKRYPL